MSEKASNLYVPDYRAWESFYEKRAKRDQKVGFGFETESEALKHQQQQEVVVHPERVKACDQGQTEPKIINIVSPTEQTVQQAASVMKKAGVKGKPRRCAKKKKSKGNRAKKANNQNKHRGKKSSFSYRTLGDIFSKRK